MQHKFNSVDEYISLQSKDVQKLLKKLREIIINAAPKAEETISYQMPTYKLNGNLVHFAAYKNHIGFYPTPSGISAFKNEFSQYKFSKGAVQFPINEKLPLGLIIKIVKHRVRENLNKKK